MTIGIYELMRERLKDFYIVDCSIRSRNCIYILFENYRNQDAEDAEVLFRAGFYYPQTERVWGYDGFVDVYKGKSCVLTNGPVVVVDFSGHVLSQTGETDKTSSFNAEKPIPLIRQVFVTRVVEIAGHAYVAGNLRTVFRRDSPGVWTCLSGNDLTIRNKQDQQGRKFGFKDIGGFSAEDIYACGGEGDLCHYDGQRWEALDCPTNQDLLSLCCAGNGKVYVGGMKGLLIEGCGDKWQVVNTGKGDRIKRMEWFKDRLYLATDQGLYEYHNGRFMPTPGLSGLIPIPGQDSESVVNERVQKLLRAGGASDEAVELVSTPGFSKEDILAPAALHSLSTDGELLIVGGADKVAVFDGVDWRILYAPYGIDIGGSL